MDTEPLDPRLVKGVAYFNAGAFFDAHEVWEDLWRDCRDSARKFYQGLIQVAVCLHHFRNRNTRGARSLYYSATSYLQRYRPVCQQIDLDRLLDELRCCCADILADQSDRPRGSLNPDLIPQIRWTAQPSGSNRTPETT